MPGSSITGTKQKKHKCSRDGNFYRVIEFSGFEVSPAGPFFCHITTIGGGDIKPALIRMPRTISVG